MALWLSLSRILALSFCFVFSFSSAHARWATIEEAPIENIFRNANVHVHEDGTCESIVEERMKVLLDSGRSSLARYTLVYRESCEEIQIIEAKTINGTAEDKLQTQSIEDKPLASVEQGFDQTRQILLSFPKLQVGSEIYVKYVLKSKQRPFGAFYSALVSYDWRYLKAGVFQVTSKIPLHMKVHDPENFLKVSKSRDASGHRISIVLQRPIFKDVVLESNSSNSSGRERLLVDEKLFPWVSISSLQKWEDLALRIADKYEQKLDQDIPENFQDILRKAQEGKSEEEQINLVTSQLAEKMQYMGEWRSVMGAHIPRDLKIIAASNSGDCKDFSVMAGAILKKLGFKVQAAVISAGLDNRSFEGCLPYHGNFNHAFLKVTGKKVYWVDPTSSLSMAAGIMPDLADKRVLILDSKHPSYEKTPAINPNSARTLLTDHIQIKDGVVLHHGDVKIFGEAAIRLQGMTLWTSEKFIKDSLFQDLSYDDLKEEDKIEIVLPDLKSRIVQDLAFTFKYRQPDGIIKTNSGNVLSMKPNHIFNKFNASPQRVSDLIVGPPVTQERLVIIEKIKIKNIERLNYSKTTPWLDVTRSCKHEGDDTVINTKIIRKKNYITWDEQQTPEYQQLRAELFRDFVNVAIALEE